jgi:hypothetical protein
VLLAIVAGLYLLRERMIIRAPMLAIVFDHQDHPAVKCDTCHHNFFDKTGQDSCYFCHKKRPELALRVEADFHGLCRDCHARLARQGYASGPVRQCAECHAWQSGQPGPH